MFGRVLVGRPWEDVMFAGAVLANVAATLAVGVEIAQGAPVRLLVATVVVLLLSFPWTNWAQNTALEARRQRETRARENRIVGSVQSMNTALEDKAEREHYDRTHTTSRHDINMATNAGRDPWDED